MYKIRVIGILFLSMMAFNACSAERQKTPQPSQERVPIIINGHTLPLEPDHKINNATLSGIDSNGNGVRDDVERKIYLQYDEEIERQYLMMSARKQQKRLKANDLIQNAEKWERLDRYTFGCISYISHEYGIRLYGNIDFVLDNVYNTRSRLEKYMAYNQALSGGVYGTPKSY